MISSVVTAWKANKLDVARSSTSATGALAVESTPAAFDATNPFDALANCYIDLGSDG